MVILLHDFILRPFTSCFPEINCLEKPKIQDSKVEILVVQSLPFNRACRTMELKYKFIKLKNYWKISLKYLAEFKRINELLFSLKSTENHIGFMMLSGRLEINQFTQFSLNLFVPNAPFLFPLKTSENLTVFWYFQGVEKGCIGNKWINIRHKIYQRSFSHLQNEIFYR